MSTNQQVALLVPPLLIASMYGAFRYLTAVFGFPAGYLTAFALYWVGWCLIVPAAILRQHRPPSLFTRSTTRFTKLSGITHVLLWWPIAFPLTFSFAPRIASTPWLIVATSIVIVTGTVVTGAGPQAGDDQVARLDIAVTDIARIHAEIQQGLAAVVIANENGG